MLLKRLMVLAVALCAAIENLVSAAEIAPIDRTLPPVGIKLDAEQVEAIEQALAKFDARWIEIGRRFKGSPDSVRSRFEKYAPDVLVFPKAVRFALDCGEFYRPQDLDTALRLISLANERATTLHEASEKDLAEGNISWTHKRGLLVRGYRSEIDDSVQPYGLLIPETLDLTQPVPLYIWLHGRNDKGTDLHFIADRMKSRGEFVPEHSIVLHPFGRYCNAFKFAGEKDVFEAISSVATHYNIDSKRIVLIGFSMGGAGAWHLAAHYPDLWAAASPGAGFVDTQRYQNLHGDRLPPWYEQKLWGLYDVPAHARNLFNVPVVAYSGELDKQKASADIMEEEFTRHGRRLDRVIGKGMGHKYDSSSKIDILSRMKKAEDAPKSEPTSISLQTPTLAYCRPRADWFSLHGLERHWEDSRVDAETMLMDGVVHRTLATRNVSRIALHFAPGSKSATASIDGQAFQMEFHATGQQDPSVRFERQDSKWAKVDAFPAVGSVKSRELQGPIDDIFFDRFIFVSPTSRSEHTDVQRWVEFEMRHQIQRWRQLFRGDPLVKEDSAITSADIRDAHLVLWGDHTSNRIMARVLSQLPFAWTEKSLRFGKSEHSAATRLPVLIYPNPLNPEKYIVLNSGPTFREAHDKTNSQQTPKLPDWAVIDITSPPDAMRPGRVVDAGFFDERWQFQEHNQTAVP